MANNNTFGNHISSGMFKGLKKPNGISAYAKMRGLTDFSKVEQFEQFEGGYPFLVMLKWPLFFNDMTGEDRTLVETYRKVIEYEFKGLDGLDNLQSDPGEITNGINTLQMINKVTRQSNGTFQMRFNEKAGSTITRTHELYLRNIKDPDTQVKMYPHRYTNGKWGYEYEVFTYLYFVTDSALLNIEKAFLLTNAQPTNAELNIYNAERGQIEFKEVTVEFNAFVVSNAMVYEKANQVLQALVTTNEYVMSEGFKASGMTTGTDANTDANSNYAESLVIPGGASAYTWSTTPNRAGDKYGNN